MKTIMTAGLGLGLLAGVHAVPASAGSYDGLSAAEYNRMLRLERKKQRRYVERQIEYDANTLPLGTSTWWQQMDREQRGGRR
jgi:hypothetical protein